MLYTLYLPVRAPFKEDTILRVLQFHKQAQKHCVHQYKTYFPDHSKGNSLPKRGINSKCGT